MHTRMNFVSAREVFSESPGTTPVQQWYNTGARTDSTRDGRSFLASASNFQANLVSEAHVARIGKLETHVSHV